MKGTEKMILACQLNTNIHINTLEDLHKLKHLIEEHVNNTGSKKGKMILDNFENYLPIITTSKTNILKSSLVFSLYFSAPIFFINIVKKDDLVDKNKFNKYFFIMHLFTFLIVFFAILLTLLSLEDTSL